MWSKSIPQCDIISLFSLLTYFLFVWFFLLCFPIFLGLVKKPYFLELLNWLSSFHNQLSNFSLLNFFPWHLVKAQNSENHSKAVDLEKCICKCSWCLSNRESFADWWKHAYQKHMKSLWFSLWILLMCLLYDIWFILPWTWISRNDLKSSVAYTSSLRKNQHRSKNTIRGKISYL